MITTLEKNIARVIVWFSLTNHPLTVNEITRWISQSDRVYSIIEIDKCLIDSDWLKKRIIEDGGYYRWKTSSYPLENSLEKRAFGYRDSLHKYKIAKKAVKYLSWIPSVYAVSAVNSMGMWITRPESDIDFVILVAPQTIWISRLLAVLPFAILKRRPGSFKKINKPAQHPLCFSFFLTTDSLCLEGISIDGGDPYLAHWLASMTPLFDTGGWFSALNEANRWYRQFLPAAEMRASHKNLICSEKSTSYYTVRLMRFFEPLAKLILIHKLPVFLRRSVLSDRSIVVSDRMLKFHAIDRRKLYREGFVARLKVFYEGK